jgi:small-conductance mechanosensitive channel
MIDKRRQNMGKVLKNIISALIGILALMLFTGEAGIQLFWLQLLAGAALVGILAWNGAFKEAL